MENSLKLRSRYTVMILFIFFSILVPLLYSLYTNNAWEDFFITFRHSKNLVEGNGLVYNPGERVHGFTSPIGVLLLAFCYLVTGKTSYLAALWLFRVMSLVAFSVGGVFLLSSLSDENRKQILPTVFLGTLYLFETKSVVFSTNGMETAFMLLFLGWFIMLLRDNPIQNWVLGGICWGGLMWTRPDGLVYIVAFSLSLLVFSKPPRRETLTLLLKIASISLFIYLPWFVWAWTYYGHPIPHTILAKLHLKGEMTWLLVYKYTFSPIYCQFGGWPKWIKIFSYILGFFSSFYWVLPLKDRIGRMVSFAIFLLHFYFLAIWTSPWYFPPLAMMDLFVLVNGFFTLSNMGKKRFVYRKALIVGLLSLICAGMVYIFIMTVFEMKILQKEVEDGNRKKVGLWLKEHVKKEETVYSESLGYIGYFSEAKMIDYPGLVSPVVVGLLNNNRNLNFYTLIPEIKPDWIVFRPWEAAEFSRWDYFKDNYYQVKTFSVGSNLLKYKFFPGEVYLFHEAEFMIFKKN